MRKKPNRPSDAKDLSSYTITQPLKDMDSPEEVIAFMRSKGWYEGEAANLEKLVDELDDLRVIYEDTDPNDAYIRMNGDHDFIIGINIKHARNRQRWSLAHELAHYFLHKEKIKSMPIEEKILHRNDSSNAIERQANNFAAHLLMPEDRFFYVLNKSKGNISEIAEDFEVSELAVRYRAKALEVGGHGV